VTLDSYTVNFSGQILERSFWIYTWRIDAPGQMYLYVGRTGDTSSINAASPYRRLSQHLNDRKNSRSNALHRRLVQRELLPTNCKFRFSAVGPLWPEEDTREAHNRTRDRAAALERAVADYFVANGYEVLGQHPRHGQVDKDRLSAVIAALENDLSLHNNGDSQ
jgi:hypothetical protein